MHVFQHLPRIIQSILLLPTLSQPLDTINNYLFYKLALNRPMWFHRGTFRLIPNFRPRLGQGKPCESHPLETHGKQHTRTYKHTGQIRTRHFLPSWNKFGTLWVNIVLFCKMSIALCLMWFNACENTFKSHHQNLSWNHTLPGRNPKRNQTS